MSLLSCMLFCMALQWHLLTPHCMTGISHCTFRSLWTHFLWSLIRRLLYLQVVSQACAAGTVAMQSVCNNLPFGVIAGQSAICIIGWNCVLMYIFVECASACCSSKTPVSCEHLCALCIIDWHGGVTHIESQNVVDQVVCCMYAGVA